MKGSKKVLKQFQKLLNGELAARDQYMAHSRIYKDLGLNKLYERLNHEMEEETEHADALVERILFLEGLPNLQDLGKLRIGEDVPEILQCDLDLEMDAIPDLRAGIAYCEAHKDYVTREVFDQILQSEEEHVDWLEPQVVQD